MFTGKEVNNVSFIQRPWWLYCISNPYKNKHFFITSSGTIIVSKVTSDKVVLENKSLKIGGQGESEKTLFQFGM